MDYKEIQAMMDSGHGAALVAHLSKAIASLRDIPIDPTLPAEQYKVNALARQEAVQTLKHILTPFIDYQKPHVKKNLDKDNLYYSHLPKLEK